MDLKANLELPGWLSGKKRVDKWVVIVLGLFGLALIIGAAWLALADWRSQREVAAKSAEAEAAAAQDEIVCGAVGEAARALVG